MRYYIIAGEASGDLHASNLIKQIKLLDRNAEFRGWGGDLMQAQGTEIVKHYRDLAFMGFVEVAANLRTIFKNIEWCKNDIVKYKPDAVILVDYPGFNLRIAKFSHEAGYKIFYYISPQVWAWKSSRVQAIKKNVDRMFVILPFEKDFYKDFDYDVSFIGHPLLDVIEEKKSETDFRKKWLEKNSLPDKPVVALIPGSREQEILTMLPVMLSVVNKFSEFQFVIAGAPGVQQRIYDQVIKKHFSETHRAGETLVKVVYHQTYDLLKTTEAALVTSGTATLETALFEVPEVVCYKGNFISYHIAKKLIKVKYISLVNLIMDKPAVKELIQSDLTTENLITELKRLLSDKNYRTQMQSDFSELKNKLGGKGASERAAKEIVGLMNK
ncbi:MAG: lipid-A-disaccharide synthase [Bacteroidia bacterium]